MYGKDHSDDTLAVILLLQTSTATYPAKTSKIRRSPFTPPSRASRTSLTRMRIPLRGRLDLDSRRYSSHCGAKRVEACRMPAIVCVRPCFQGCFRHGAIPIGLPARSCGSAAAQAAASMILSSARSRFSRVESAGESRLAMPFASVTLAGVRFF